MADEKKTPVKAKEPKDQNQGDNKFLNWIKALPQRIATPFRNMVHELKRVTWPSKQKTITYSIIVLVFIVVMMVIIGLFDLGSSALIGLKPAQVTPTPAPAVITTAEAAGTVEAPAAATVEANATVEAAPAATGEAPATDVPAEAPASGEAAE